MTVFVFIRYYDTTIDGRVKLRLLPNIGQETGVAPIAVHPRVNDDELVVEPDHRLKRRIGAVIQPILCVIESVAYAFGNAVGLPAKAPSGFPIGPGPSPDA